MIEFVQEITEILERTPAVLRAQLHALPARWSQASEREDSWSPYDVVGHLVHGEGSDWIPRMRIILEMGEGQTFGPFDRIAQERESVGKSLEVLLDEFEQLRGESLRDLNAAQLAEADLERTGTHPAFGRVTLRQLLSTWGAHDLGHVAQIERTMARRYSETAGPWSAYLPILGKV